MSANDMNTPNANELTSSPAAGQARISGTIKSNKPDSPNVIPLDRLPPPTPFPLEDMPDNFRAVVGEITDRVKVGSPLAALTVLAAMAHVAQTRVNATRLDGGTMPTSLYLLTLGDSGSRKTSVFDLVFEPVREAERDLSIKYMREFESLEKEEAGITHKKGKEEFRKQNPLPEDPRSLISSDASISRVAGDYAAGKVAYTWLTDEGGAFFGSHNFTNNETSSASRAILLKLFDNGSGERLRAKSNLDGSGSFYNRRLTAFIMAQQIAVQEYLNDPVAQGQGFLPRFIFGASNTPYEDRIVSLEEWNKNRRKARASSVIASFHERLKDLNSAPQLIKDNDPISGIDPQKNVFDWSAGANEVFFHWNNEVNQKQCQGGEYVHLTAFASRSAELAVRTATVLAYFYNHKQVEREDAHAAVALVRYSLAEWSRFLFASSDRITVDAINCIDWIRAKVSKGDKHWLRFTNKKWSQFGPNKYRSAKIRDAVLGKLVEHKYLYFGGSEYIYASGDDDVNGAPLANPANSANDSPQTQAQQGLAPESESCYQLLTVANPTVSELGERQREPAISNKLATVSKSLATQNPHEQEALAELAELATPSHEYINLDSDSLTDSIDPVTGKRMPKEQEEI